MRPRALVWLLPLTAGDYLLWNWSLGGSHDVLALISGMTLLPLAALSLGLLGLTAIGVLGGALRKSSTVARRLPSAHPNPQEAAHSEEAVAPATSERASATSERASATSERASATSERASSTRKLAA